MGATFDPVRWVVLDTGEQCMVFYGDREGATAMALVLIDGLATNMFVDQKMILVQHCRELLEQACARYDGLRAFSRFIDSAGSGVWQQVDRIEAGDAPPVTVWVYTRQ